MSESYRFSENDSLLCYHGPMLYEAKCLKRRKSNEGKAQYFIHYKGWNSKWEEWVNDDRVLAVNATNMNKMASLKEIHSSSKKSVVKRSITITKEETIRNATPTKGKKRKHSEISIDSDQTISVLSPSEPKPKKRGRPPKSLTNFKNDVTEAVDATELSETIAMVEPNEPPVAPESVKSETLEENKLVEKTDGHEENKTTETSTVDVFVAPAPVVKTIPVINIPMILKRRLAYDKIMVTQLNKIHKVPKKYTTEKLIRAFINSSLELGFAQREKSLNTGLTLIQYFNQRIHKSLLYHEERVYGIKNKAQNRLVKKVRNKSLFHFKDKLFPKRMWHYAYGPTYLLRLFDELPKLLSSYWYNEKQMAFIVRNFEYFLKFVESNYNKYFSEDDYEAVNIAP